MRSAAAAFAWEFRRRLRAGLIALAVYLLVLGTVQLVLGPRSPIHPSNETTFAFTVTVPLTAAFFFLLAAFTNGVPGDLTARQSMYLARMFTLPATTAELAVYPMFYGSVALAAVRVVALLAVVWPRGVR